MPRGVVAAGHELTADAGAAALRAGGNAVDAALGAMLASFVAESPLTGLGAGGYMLVRTADGEETLIDFFVAAPGLGGSRPSAELDLVPIHFNEEVSQDFCTGPASNGVPGIPAGIAHVAKAYGSLPLVALAEPAVSAAREGVEVNEQQGYLHEILAPILTREPAGEAIYAPGGKLIRAGGRLRMPALADDIERLAEEGPAPFYEGELAAAMVRHVTGLGGAVSEQDLAGYEAIERTPVRARFGGAEILTNPPPSSGGILICAALNILDRLGESSPAAIVGASRYVQSLRTREFYERLDPAAGDDTDGGLAAELLGERAIADAVAGLRSGASPAAPPAPGDRLGSTTHITAVDSDGMCAAVTCSNGAGSGVFVPGTGIHLNNMLGEQDLSPLGYHSTPAGRRMASMMSPTLIVEDGELVAGLGSGGSNRIRSAIVQTVIRLRAEHLTVADAVEAPRLHFEDEKVEAEPGFAEADLAAIDSAGIPIHRWQSRNLFFGGVHAVARDPRSGELSAAGDPRRGGAVARA